MRKNFLKLMVSVLGIGIMVSSCEGCKERQQKETLFNNGILVAYEGLYGQNNGGITYYDIDSNIVSADVFREKNARGLGDTPNDIKLYGGKLYVVVNMSNSLEVIDVYTGKSLAQLSIKDANGVGMQPRKIDFYQGKAYLCCYNGQVLKIDTTTLSIENKIQVGKNPEDLCVVGSELYVCNSGGLDYPNCDSTISVINLNTFRISDTIIVSPNPARISVDYQGNVYVACWGASDWNTFTEISPNCWQKINTKTKMVEKTMSIPVNRFVLNSTTAYLLCYDNTIRVFDLASEKEMNNFITDNTKIDAPYSVAVDAKTGNVLIGDAEDYSTNGTVFVFNKAGKKQYEFETGINPTAILPITSNLQ